MYKNAYFKSFVITGNLGLGKTILKHTTIFSVFYIILYLFLREILLH